MLKNKVLLLVISILLIFTGCFNSSKDTAPFTLKELAEANSYDKLFEKNNSVSINSIYYFENDEIESEFNYLSVDKNNNYISAFEDSNGYVSVIKDNSEYTFDSADNTFSIGHFIKNVYEKQILPEIKKPVVEYSENEVIKNLVTENDKYILTTEDTFPIDDNDNENVNIKIIYSLDNKTLTVEKMDVFEINSDKTENKICELTITLNNTYEIPEFVAQLQNPTETRKITLITDYGKENEETYNFDIYKDAYFMCLPPTGYNAYTDKENSVLLASEKLENPFVDRTIYISKD